MINHKIKNPEYERTLSRVVELRNKEAKYEEILKTLKSEGLKTATGAVPNQMHLINILRTLRNRGLVAKTPRGRPVGPGRKKRETFTGTDIDVGNFHSSKEGQFINSLLALNLNANQTQTILKIAFNR